MIFMAQDEFRDVNLTIDIKGAKGIKRCPYCGEKPNKIEWRNGELRMWCRSDNCSGSGHYRILSKPIQEGELDLVKVSRAIVNDWNIFCDSVIRQREKKATA